MSIKAVIFDLDGTLLDTERLFSECLIEAADDEGWKLEVDTILDCIGTTEAETERIVRNAMGKDYPYELIRQKGVVKFSAYVEEHGIPYKNGAMRLLDCLEMRNIPYGLATTTERKDVDRILTFAGIIDRFATTVCGDEVFRGKPDPEVYYKVAGNLGIRASEALVFEDSNMGISAAAAAGARVVWIPDLQEVPDNILKLCFDEIGSLDAVCDRIEDLLR